MNFEFNKIAGAVLGTGLGVMAISIISEIIYEPHHPEQPGYVIAVVDGGGEGHGGGGGAEEVAPIADRLQVADLDEGMTQSKKCLACHTFENGGPAKVGPNLWNVVGGPYAHAPGFAYSEVFQEAAAEGDTWTFEALDEYLQNPRAEMPGTAMAFAGIRDPQQRADLILYLRSLSDDPVPLPAVTASAETEAGTGTETEAGTHGEVAEEATPESEAAEAKEMEAGESEQEMADDAAAAEDMVEEADMTGDATASEDAPAADDAAKPADATETPDSDAGASEEPADEATPADSE